MTIDSHHHFWRYNAREYDWLGDDMASLRRDFEPQHLKVALDSADIEGAISVQARQSLEETHWLLNMAREHPFIVGVVGWVPLASPEIAAVLEGLAREKKLKGVRHVVQGEADGFLEGAAFNAGIALLKRFHLTYDLLIVERQLSEAIVFVDRHPNQRFVLDHIAKPLIKGGSLEPWKSQIGELAKRENVCCKMSGMVTEADFGKWTPDQLKPYFDVVLEAFGPARLMFGSDWPVCLAACEYARWANIVREWATPLSPDERADLMGECARRVYNV